MQNGPVKGSAGQNLSCGVCGVGGFKSAKALAQHSRVKHHERCSMNRFVSSSKCLVCARSFADRLRVIAHLSDPRQRGKTYKRTCREVVLAGGVLELPRDLVVQLDQEARVQRRSARKAGHTRPVVPWHKRAVPLAELHPLHERPAKRLRCKTSKVEWVWTRPQDAMVSAKRRRRCEH